MNNRKVFVSGCYDLLHAGHIEFFRQASQFGKLFVCVGSDKTILELKNHESLMSEDERAYIVGAIKYVHETRVSRGSGFLDFLPEFIDIKPDVFVVNEDGHSQEKEQLCKDNDVEYIVLKRTPPRNFPARSSTSLKASMKEQ